ncbi:unnamed protein product, partial [Closterium sp. NIES-53]
RVTTPPHSSFPPTMTPHLDVWAPSTVLGPHQERYFLVVVVDYSRYTKVFPLRRKADVPTVLEPWLLARGGAQGMCGLRLHSDRGGEFSSTRLQTFCQGRGIIQSYMLPASPQPNGVAERCIGLVMEVAQNSICHAGAPQFLWPHAVFYAAHQLNLWPSDAWPQVTPVSLLTGSFGVAAQFHVWGSLAHVCAPGANKLFARTRACVFLGFPLDASGWVPPQIAPIAPPPPPPSCPAPSGVSHVTPQSSPPRRLVHVVSEGAGGAVAEGAGSGAAGAGGVGSGGAGGVGVKVTPVEDTAASSRWPCPASPPGFPSVPQFPPRSSLRPVAVGPRGVPAGGGGGAGSGGVGAGGTGIVAPTPRTGTAAAAAAGAVLVAAAGDCRGGVKAAAGVSRGGVTTAAAGAVAAATGESRGGVTSAAAGVVAVAARESRGGVMAAAAGAIAAAAGESREGFTGAAAGAVVVAAGEGRAGDPPVAAGAVLDTAGESRGVATTVGEGSAGSSLTVLHNLLSDYLRASRLVVSRVLSALVTHLTAPLSSILALVTAVAGFASSHRLDYVAYLVSGPTYSPSSGGAPVFPLEVLEDRQFELSFLAAAIAAEEADMAYYRSTGTYVDAVPPPGANIVGRRWLYKVKRPPGSPLVFKACYVARGFRQQEGVDFFQTFAPTPKMTTLRVLLHIAAQRDYELHSLDFSTAFLQGSLHERIWLRRPPSFTGSFPPRTQWQLRRPVYGLHHAPREWHDTLCSTLAALDFFPSSTDPSLFVRHGSTPFFVLVYVDDLVFATPDQRALASVKEELQRRHTCTDLDELQHHLGLSSHGFASHSQSWCWCWRLALVLVPGAGMTVLVPVLVLAAGAGAGTWCWRLALVLVPGAGVTVLVLVPSAGGTTLVLVLGAGTTAVELVLVLAAGTGAGAWCCAGVTTLVLVPGAGVTALELVLVLAAGAGAWCWRLALVMVPGAGVMALELVLALVAGAGAGAWCWRLALELVPGAGGWRWCRCLVLGPTAGPSVRLLAGSRIRWLSCLWVRGSVGLLAGRSTGGSVGGLADARTGGSAGGSVGGSAGGSAGRLAGPLG